MKNKIRYIVLRECSEYSGCDGAIYFEHWKEANAYYKNIKNERAMLIYAKIVKENEKSKKERKERE